MVGAPMPSPPSARLAERMGQQLNSTDPVDMTRHLRAGGDGGAGRAFALPLFGGPYRK